jgi:hypothetical protein
MTFALPSSVNLSLEYALVGFIMKLRGQTAFQLIHVIPDHFAESVIHVSQTGVFVYYC